MYHLSCSCKQGWKPGYLLLGCQLQFECDEKQMPGISFGLISRVIKNRFKFWFQFCLCMASVLGFQFRLSFTQENCIFLNTHYSDALLFGVFALIQ